MDSKLYQDLGGPDPLASARCNARALAAAARMKDEAAWMVCAVRMRQTLERANASLGRCFSTRDITRASELYALTVKTRTLRETAPTQLTGESSRKVLRWGNATTSHGLSGAHADLFESEANGAALPLASFARLFLLRVRLESAELSGASFDDAVLDGCLLSGAAASSTYWCSAQLVSCQLVGIDLRDAALGYALFVDCDLREADLSAFRRSDPQGIVGAIFVRCDLRGSKWDGRTLHNVTFSECRMHGVQGRPQLAGVRVARPDLSLAGDGSFIGDAADVRALWEGQPCLPRSTDPSVAGDQDLLDGCAVDPENALDGTGLGALMTQSPALRGARQ